MYKIYQKILEAKEANQKLLAVLLDPDDINLEYLDVLILKINQSPATHIFVGGSLVETINCNYCKDCILNTCKSISFVKI